MRKAHAFAISCVLALCAVTGAVAAMKTVHLGAASAAPVRAAASAIASRREKLDRWGASLRSARASRPPKLPAVPRFPAVAIPAAPAPVRTAAPVHPAETHGQTEAKKTSAAPAAAPTVTYVQPPPIVQYRQAPPTTAAPAGWSDDQGESDDSSQQGDDSGTEADG